MNPSLSAYTHLESLLLFQSLHAYGLGPHVFSRVSELLKGNPHIAADKRFESGRLSPDALRNFYLQILKEEVVRERERERGGDGKGANGDADADGDANANDDVNVKGSRKRKAPSPSLPTVQESIQHQHLIPHLVNKLYAGYRSAITDQIRHDEERHDTLQRELQGIERGEWDGQLRERAPPSVSPPLSPSPRKKHTPADHRDPSSTPHLQPQQPAPATRDASPGQSVSTLGSPSPPQPNQPLGDNGIPQHAGAPPQFSPTQQPLPDPHQLGPQSPSVQTPQQQQNYPPYAGRPPPPYPPQQQMGQPPPQGGFMPPPFQASPQDPARAQQPIHPQYLQVSTPVSVRQPTAKATPQSTNLGRQDVPPMHPLVTRARLSFSTPSGIRTPHSAISTPRSAKTLWKASVRSLATPDAPRPEPEPIDDYPSAQSQQQSASKAKTPRNLRAKGKAKEKEKEPEPQAEDEEPAEETVPEMETRQGRSRRKAPAKRARPRSVASSQAGTSVRERSRSQSILSHTETIAADNESQVGSRIKSERGNSIDAVEEDVATTPQVTTRRRGNLHASQPSKKRKRNVRETSPEEAEEHLSVPGLPQTVVAPRHFSRMCTPLMNDIGSHKHASTFTTAVKAKDAEGYYEIIKRPTDLKSIQKAIAAGAKQVTAAASGDTPAGSPGGGGGVVELPASADNVPPKAIVNSAQLEKELMRMFVNAVMFNAGEEGVVEDAREMFETVQRSVSSWRSVERSSGRLEVEETPPVVEEDVPAAPKRRKL